ASSMSVAKQRLRLRTSAAMHGTCRGLLLWPSGKEKFLSPHPQDLVRLLWEEGVYLIRVDGHDRTGRIASSATDNLTWLLLKALLLLCALVFLVLWCAGEALTVVAVFTMFKAGSFV